MKRPATTSLQFKKGRFLSIFVFVAFFSMAVSSLVSNPVSASSQWDNLIINQQPLNISIYNNSPKVLSPSDPISDYEKYIINKEFHSPFFSDFLNPQYKNFPDYQQFQSESYDYESGARWAIFSEPSYMGNSLYPVSTPLLVFADSDFEMVSVLDYYKRPTWMLKNRSNQTKEVRYYRFLVSSGFNTFPFTGFSGFSYQKSSCAAQGYCFLNGRGSFTSLKSFVNNFDIQYPDNYSGDQFITEYSSLPKFKVDYSYTVNKGKINIQLYKPDQLPQFEWDNMRVQQVYNIGVQCDDESIVDFKDDVGIPFQSGLKYYFPDSCIVSSSKNLIFRFHFQSYDFKKYDFETLEFSIQYTSDLVKFYNSNTSISPLVACDLIDIPCHLNNFFIKFFDFLKWVFIPSFSDFKSYFDDFFVDIRESIGGAYGFVQSVMLSFQSFVSLIYPSLFDSNYSPPCYFIPSFVVFNHAFNIDLCQFENMVGSSNFSKITSFVSVTFVFISMFFARNIVFKFFKMLGDS